MIELNEPVELNGADHSGFGKMGEFNRRER